METSINKVFLKNSQPQEYFFVSELKQEARHSHS